MFNRNEISDPHALPARKQYPWHELEENHPHGGMWQIPKASRRQAYIYKSAELMVDTDAFIKAMRRALKEWPKSVEQALTTPGLNHRAWLGHAGCFLGTGSPEETTRLGWHELDEPEQYAANAAADQVISEWRQAQPRGDFQMTLEGL